MEISIGSRLHGFTVTNIREVKELNGRLVQMVHDRTRGELLWCDNGEENKLFCITFKTLPTDDTGVFHILEHSVLCGSEKYPVKDAFVELMKGSMNTFLNALTASDWTSYPVSSRNEKDYLNLTGVYLDAVFSPAVLTNPCVFMQEGIHIEKGEEGYRYNGVVFNEMKGAMSDLNSVIEMQTLRTLFGESCYGYNSGGDPEHIPELTYEKFIETYRAHYNPTNARVYLDGSVSLEQTLEMLDGYYSRYDCAQELPRLLPALPVSRCSTAYFEPAQNEDDKDKGCLTVAKLMGNWEDRLTEMMFNVMIGAIASSNESVLKREMLSTGLIRDMTLSYESDIAQHYVYALFRNIQDGSKDEVLRLFREKVAQLADRGIDRDALSAAIERLEFRYREPEEPAGLIRAFGALSGWLHGGDPLDGMVYDELFRALREELKGDGFEKLLRKAFLEDEGLCIIETLPDRSEGDRKKKVLDDKLHAVVDGWTAQEAERNEEAIGAMRHWQETPDDPEDLMKLPMLTLKDVDPRVRRITTEETEALGVPVLFHRSNCHGIAYIRLYFSVNDFDIDGIRLSSLLTGMFGTLRTEKYTGAELEKEIYRLFGRLSFSMESYGVKDDRRQTRTYIVCGVSMLEKNLTQGFALLREILKKTLFTETDRIRELIVQNDIARSKSSVSHAHTYALRQAMAHYSASNCVREAISGPSSLACLHELARDIDRKTGEIVSALERIRDRIFCSSRLLISVTGQSPVDLTELVRGLPAGEPGPASAGYTYDGPEKAGLRIPADSGYAVQAWLPELNGSVYHGSMKVLTNILSCSYLWEEVRVKGGAYGTSIDIGRGGFMFTYSYRDPSPVKSLTVNGRLGEAIGEILDGDDNIDKYIISTIAGEEPLRSPGMAGTVADTDWFNGDGIDEIQKERDEMLETTPEILRSYAPLLKAFAENGCRCIAAGDAALKEAMGYTVTDL